MRMDELRQLILKSVFKVVDVEVKTSYFGNGPVLEVGVPVSDAVFDLVDTVVFLKIKDDD